jgi:hypothetical protein
VFYFHWEHLYLRFPNSNYFISSLNFFTSEAEKDMITASCNCAMDSRMAAACEA